MPKIPTCQVLQTNVCVRTPSLRGWPHCFIHNFIVFCRFSDWKVQHDFFAIQLSIISNRVWTIWCYQGAILKAWCRIQEFIFNTSESFTRHTSHNSFRRGWYFFPNSQRMTTSSFLQSRFFTSCNTKVCESDVTNFFESIISNDFLRIRPNDIRSGIVQCK